MNPSDAAEVLGRALREDRLVALVGAHASAAHTDASGRAYEGLPTASDFIALCANQFGYVGATDGFNAACDKIVDRDGRTKLEELLLRYYQVPDAFSPPPAHRMLAWLPFSLYLTSNYDEFIERSLDREGRSPHVLVENKDLVQLKRWHTPVVKYHGCVTRPASLVAATVDYDTLDQHRSLLRDHVAGNLAGKTLLVVGHGLGDSDLTRILSGVVERLREYRPSIFVLRQPTHDGRSPGMAFPVEIVAEDLTEFLSRLLQHARQTVPGSHTRGSDEVWLSSAFFATLRKAASLPSETQVIDAFLEHLQEEVSARASVAEVLDDADAAVSSALRVRPNYEAVRKTWADVMNMLRAIGQTSAAEIALQDFRDGRRNRIAHFRRLGGTLIQKNERVLLFSQSQRVVQVLLGVPQSVQKTVHLFVSECRPKSPLPYQDAAAIAQQLRDSHFAITVCPDVVAGHLLENHQIDRVLMGTHAAFGDPKTGEVHSFVNTCGSSMLALTAQRCGVQVEIVAEELKIEAISPADAPDHLHIHQENDLLESAIGLRDIATRRGPVSHLNIGYDLVQTGPGITSHVPDEVAPSSSA